MRLTLGRKLGLGFGVILSLMTFSAVVNRAKSADIRQTEDSMLELHFPALEVARELQRDLNYTQVKGRQAILAGDGAPQMAGGEEGLRRSLGLHCKGCRQAG